MAISNSLFTELARSSVLMMSLHGVRTVLERELGIKNVMIATDDAIKREKLRKGETEYPYAYISMSEIIGIKDQNNNRVMQRLGVRAGLSGATRATSRKGYMFPVNIQIDLKYTDSDPSRIITMAESMVILSMIGGLQFEMKVSDAVRFLVRVEIPESTSIPISSPEGTEGPGGTELVLGLIIHTYVGFFREVSAVNSGSPIMDIQITVHGDAGGADEIIDIKL